MTLLSVNLNKVALLRNARGENEPNLLHAAQTCINAGCGGITVHPRPDQRHIRPDDVRALAELLRDRVEYNIEGNPFALPRGSYPGLLALVRETRPSQVTLVPDHDSQLTSDHGFDLHADARRLHPLVTELRALDCRVSLFVDPGPLDAECARALGITRVELHTGPYAHAFASGSIEHSLEHYMVTARSARHAGLLINAGHDLNQANLGTFHAALPELAEVSIGHALIAEALYEGLETTVRHYLDILRLRRS